MEPFAWRQGPRVDDAASSAVVAALEQSVVVQDASAVPSGPVLLVAASMRTGWAITVVAAMLREAGATAVLPLVVHQLP